MKNILIPIRKCDNTPSEWEPSLIPAGFQFDQLVPHYTSLFGGYGFNYRDDLRGLIRNQTSLTIVQLDDGGVYMLKNPDKFLASRE